MMPSTTLHRDGVRAKPWRVDLARRLVTASLGLAAVALVAGAVMVPGSARAEFPGLAKCLKDCDGDKECEADCRELYMDDEDRKEHYRSEFRACWDKCYDLSGQAREECNEDCRKDYKTGLDLD